VVEDVYISGVYALRCKRRWRFKERKCLKKHLSQFDINDRMRHLEILRTTPKPNINYDSPKGRVWSVDVELFMSGRRIRSGVTNDIGNLRRKNDEITHQMLQNGWCESTIQLLRQALHVPGLHLAMLLLGPSVTLSQRRNHKSCSVTQCNGLQVDERTYRPAHDSEKCLRGCDSVRTDSSSLDRVIKDSKGEVVPRIALPSDEQFPLDLRIEDDGPYIAVSHVWAHGIGNSDNTMPLCQFRRLQRFLKEMQGASPVSNIQFFWMDTLCVPAANQYPDSRSQAISRIAKIFHNAEKVLVLDATLLHTSLKNTSSVELCIRILASDWMRRLWTLEEAMLACYDTSEKLVFRFRDGDINLKQLIDKLDKENCPYARSAMFALQKNLTLSDGSDGALFRPWYPEVDSIVPKFAQLAKAIEYRSVSKPGDETVCMASILRPDSPQVAKADTLEKKMINFYLQLKHLPISILFCNGNRISAAPFRWAISSFLTSENPSKLDPLSRVTKTLCRCDLGGMHFQSPGILFRVKSTKGPPFNRVKIRDSQGNLFLEPTEWELSHKAPETTALGWSRIQSSNPSDYLALITNPSNYYEGVVLRITKVGRHHARYHAEYDTEFLCQVHIGRARQPKLADVGHIPFQKEATTGFYRNGGVRSRSREGTRVDEQDGQFVPDPKKGIGDFFRGVPATDADQERVFRDTVGVWHTNKDQKWRIT
jgi:hypothetical protein